MRLTIALSVAALAWMLAGDGYQRPPEKDVVLIGEQTHSAADGGFVSVIRARPRTQLAGEATAGSTGQPLGFRLPGGALGVVCSRRTPAPDGSRFVGTGIQPEVRMALRWEDVALGRDSVVDEAVEIAAQAIRADAAVIEAASRLADAPRPSDHPSRSTFRRTPGRREGRRLGEFSPTDMDAVHALLRSVLSERGYRRATSIIRHDDTLKASQPQEALGSGEYYVTVYGDPNDDSPWAWRLEGHHLSIRADYGADVSATPLVLGMDPGSAEVGGAPVLGDRELRILELIRSFDEGQRRRAARDAQRPLDALIGERCMTFDSPVGGLRLSELSSHQQSLA